MTPTLSARCGSGRLWLRVLGMFAALAALTSCGGDPAPGPSTGTPRASTVSIAMTNSAGAPTFMVSRDAPLTVTATLANGNGQPIVNSLVQLALNFAESGTPAVLTTSSGITDSNGRFSTTLLAASTSAQGGGTLTATAPNVTEAPSTVASFQVQATSPLPVGAQLALALTDPQTGAARSALNRNSPLLATATLTDGSGRPVANTLVEYTLDFTDGNVVAVLSPASGSGVTDAAGKFSVQLIASSTTATGTGTISVSAVGLSDVAPASAPFQVTATTPLPVGAQLALALTDPQSGAASSALNRNSPLLATATLSDGSGKPVANTLVQYALGFNGGNVVAVLSPASGSGVTDAAGKFSVHLIASSTTATGTGTISVSAVGLSDVAPASAPFQVTATTPLPVGVQLALALTDPQTGAARSALNRNSPLLATATLTDGSGKPVANTLVEYTLGFTGGNVVAVLSPASGSGVTDAAGKFSVQLIASSTTATGTGTISASAVGLSDVAPASAPFQVTATTPPATAPVVSLALTDPQTGAGRNTLTLASPLNATATVLDASGRPVANSLIQFSLTTAGGGSPVAVFSPASGNGLTDANGKFTVALQAAGLTSQGAGTIRATAVNELNAPSATGSFQVGATSLTIGNVTRSPADIEPLGTSTISATISGVPTSVPVTVRFTSPCATSGLSTLPASVVTVNGVASAVYTDKGCSGTDTITIGADGATPVLTTITILPAPPVAIQFVSATPETISIAGSGGQPSSVVVFKAVNAAQQAVANLAVTLSLSTSVGGVTLDGQSGPITKQTAQDGTVRVSVVAGTQPGPVRVVATAAGGLSASSSQLTIQTGMPTQNRMSLSFGTFNIEGWNVDGTTTSVTLRAADRVGNPVPDGTTINFRTAGSSIEPSCRTSGGACSVNFRSQANRPASGRVAVLAWTVGEETFTDQNGNNRYDTGEPWGDLGDAFVDANLDGSFTSGEEFIAFNPAATLVCASNALSAPGRPNSCDGVWGTAHVRGSGLVVLSGSNAFAQNLPSSIRLTGPNEVCGGSFGFTLLDVNGNPMPAGTTISASITGGTATVFGSPVPNTTSPSGVGIELSVPAEPVAGSDPPISRCQGQGVKTLRISVTTPLGTTTVLPAVTVIY